MSPAIITLLVLLVIGIFFVNNKLPLGLVAMAGATLLALLGIIDKKEILSAFAGSTMALLVAMMIVGAALFQTGLADVLSKTIVKITGHSEVGIMIASMVVGVVISSICSGAAVVAMMLPIVIGLAREGKVSVSRQLIPLSFAASIGGNLTLVGAASNASTAGLIEEMGIDFVGFFDIGKVGVPLCIIFFVYMLTVGKKLLTPGDSSNKEYLDEYTKRSNPEEFNKVKAGITAVVLIAILVAMVWSNKEWPMYFIAVIGAIVLILTGCISERDAFKAIDMPTVFILGGMSAVSVAMTESGACDMIAEAVVGMLGSNPNKYLFLFVVLVLVMIITNICTNTSTVLLVTPIFVPMAVSLGINPVATGVAIMVAASSPFLTPVGSTTNTLIIGPGNITTRDFFVPGIGLTILSLIVCMIFIPLFWPL